MTDTRVPWWDDYLVAFDLETTGPDPETARVVTAHVSLVDPAGGADGRTLVINPGVPIPDEAAAVHGYTTARVADEGMERTFGLGALYGLLSWQASRHPVVAFNAAYDFTVMDRELRRAGLPPIAPAAVIDPFVLDRHVDKWRKGPRKLADVCALYGVDLVDAHTADADALAAVAVARAIGMRYGYAEGVLPPDAAALHAYQVRWRAEQSASLQAYLRRTDPSAVVDGTWPVHPVGPAGVEP